MNTIQAKSFYRRRATLISFALLSAFLTGCLSDGQIAAITACAQSSGSCPGVAPSETRDTSSTTTLTGVTTTKILGSTSAPYGFVEYIPGGYNELPSNKWPLIIMLHGLGEQGPANTVTEVNRAAVHGPNRRIREGRHFPAVILTPQTPVWWNSNTVKTFIDFALATYRIDPKRIYITGLSMGGGGTWDIGGHSVASTKIAALVPMCGAAGANSTGAGNIIRNRIAVWAFHNQDDGTVGIGNSDGWMNAFGTILTSGNTVRADNPTGNPTKTAHYRLTDNRWEWRADVNSTGATPGITYSDDLHYTVYPTGGHDAWTKSYANEALWVWLFKQTR